MTKVEELLDEENPSLPSDLAIEICPACKAEVKVGEPLVHAEGCPRNQPDPDERER